ncbi:hypothetical protein IKS57_03660 [bacterium]|nr:hypothetical protein [bacterium]
MNVVNTFYDYDEKLELPTPQKNFSKYKLNLLVQNGMSKSLEDPVILIDTSILSSAILEDFKNSFHIKTNTNDSFDTRS